MFHIISATLANTQKLFDDLASLLLFLAQYKGGVFIMFPQFSEVNLMLHFMVIDHIYLPAWFEDHDLTSSQILTTRTILSGAILTFNLCVINLTQC